MDLLHTNGIITHAIAFKEYDRIISLFTPNNGLIKVVVKGAFREKHSQGATTQPLGFIEAECVRRGGELYSCSNLEMIDSHTALRNDIKTLQAACEMLQIINATQLAEKNAPKLYQLLRIYLKQLPLAENAQAVALSFKLKTLRHEGLFHPHMEQPHGICKDDHDQVLVLTYSLDFPLIASLPLSGSLTQYVDSLFSNNFIRA